MRGRGRSGPDQQGSLLAELMVAAGLIVLSVMVVGATLSGPVRGIAGLGHPQDAIEGVDRLALVFVGAVRDARPHLDRPAILVARPSGLVVALGHLRDGADAGAATWELTIGEDTIVVGSQVLLHGVDASRTRLVYRDAAGHDLGATQDGLDSVARSRITLVELRIAVVDPSGNSPEVDVVHRAALRVVGPLA